MPSGYYYYYVDQNDSGCYEGDDNDDTMMMMMLMSMLVHCCYVVFQFWFATLSGFSGQIVFERWSIGLYNVVSHSNLLSAVTRVIDLCSDVKCQNIYRWCRMSRV